MGKGQKAFITTTFSPRTVISKVAAYTVLMTDDQVIVTAAAAITLPAISTMAASRLGSKMLKLTNNHTAANVATPISGSGNTINGVASYSIPAGQSIILQANQGNTNWEIVSPDMALGVDGRSRQVVVAATSGTTPVNVFSATGAPMAFTVETFESTAVDATASNITLKNGTATVASVAKGTTANAVVGEEAIANGAVAKGAVFTVESSGTGNAICKIGIVVN